MKLKYRKGSRKMPKIKSDYFKILARGSPALRGEGQVLPLSLSYTDRSPLPGPRGPGRAREHRAGKDFHTIHPPSSRPPSYPCVIPNYLTASWLEQRDRKLAPSPGSPGMTWVGANC